MDDSTDQGALRDVFVSYARVNADLLPHLRSHLRDAGASVFIDTSDLGVAAPWRENLTRAIAGSAVFLAVVSREWLDSRICREELTDAVQMGKRVILYLTEPGLSLERLGQDGDVVFCDTIDVVVEEVQMALPQGHLQARVELAALPGASRTDFLGRSGLRELRRAHAELAGHGLTPSTAARGHLRERLRRAHRRWLRLAAMATFLLLAVSGALLLAAGERETRVEESRRAAIVESRSMASVSARSDGTDAVLTGLSAIGTAPTDAAVEAARRALALEPWLETLAMVETTGEVLALGLDEEGSPVYVDRSGEVTRSAATMTVEGGPLLEARLSSDARQLLTLGEDGVARLRSLGTGDQVTVLGVGIRTMSTSSDLARVVMADAHGDIVVRVPSGSTVKLPTLPTSPVRLAVTEDGHAVAAQGRDGVVHRLLLDSSTWERVGLIGTSLTYLDFQGSAPYPGIAEWDALRWSTDANSGSFEMRDGTWFSQTASSWALGDTRLGQGQSAGVDTGAESVLPLDAHLAAARETTTGTVAAAVLDDGGRIFSTEHPRFSRMMFRPESQFDSLDVLGPTHGGFLVSRNNKLLIWQGDGTVQDLGITASGSEEISPSDVVTAADSEHFLVAEGEHGWRAYLGGLDLGLLDGLSPALVPALTTDQVIAVAPANLHTWTLSQGPVRSTMSLTGGHDSPDLASLPQQTVLIGVDRALHSVGNIVSLVELSTGSVLARRDWGSTVAIAGSPGASHGVVLTPTMLAVVDEELSTTNMRSLREGNSVRLSPDGDLVTVNLREKNITLSVPDLSLQLEQSSFRLALNWPTADGLVVSEGGDISRVCEVCAASLDDLAAMAARLTGILEVPDPVENWGRSVPVSTPLVELHQSGPASELPLLFTDAGLELTSTLGSVSLTPQALEFAELLRDAQRLGEVRHSEDCWVNDFGVGTCTVAFATSGECGEVVRLEYLRTPRGLRVTDFRSVGGTC